MPKTHGMEQYLEAVYVLAAENRPVIAARLADYLGVSRPTVTQTIQRLTSAGLVAVSEGKELRLTDAGLQRAEKIVRRHRLLERWLTDDLGLDWADAHVEAGRLEHSLSPLVEERLYEKLGRPATCPHGNVIPGTGVRQPAGIALTEADAPALVRVLRIVEQAEEDLDLLRFLYQSGIVPGAVLALEPSSTPYVAGIPVVVDGHAIALNPLVAERVRVVPT